MNKFLDLSEEELQLVIHNTADRLNLSEAIVEKDLWVCILLDYLFKDFKYKDNIVFKGGTSLSKVYHLIERFSEDIDLALDWKVLGYLQDEPYQTRSNAGQQKFNYLINEKTAIFLKEKMLPLLKQDFKRLLKDRNFDYYIDETDKLTICFDYPKYYRNKSILQVIRLEIGTLADPIPAEQREIKTYIAETYPSVFNEKIRVTVVDSLRSFFEKLTILHREANRTNGNYPTRYSRHFYDVYKMLQTNLRDRSHTELNLLKSVVEFKKKFYSSNFAKYDDIYKGKLKLVPKQEGLTIFSDDFDKMKAMLFGDSISFDVIIDELKKYEKDINETIISFW